MAHFIAEIQGSRGPASRLGTKRPSPFPASRSPHHRDTITLMTTATAVEESVRLCPCGEPLTGRQQRYHSRACQQRAHRERHRPPERSPEERAKSLALWQAEARQRKIIWNARVALRRWARRYEASLGVPGTMRIAFDLAFEMQRALQEERFPHLNRKEMD